MMAKSKFTPEWKCNTHNLQFERNNAEKLKTYESKDLLVLNETEKERKVIIRQLIGSDNIKRKQY